MVNLNRYSRRRNPRRWRCARPATPLGATLGLVFALFCLAGSAWAQIACTYEVAAIITPPPTPPLPSPIYPYAISPDGRWVVGSYNPGLSTYARGFWFDMQSKQFHALPMPAGANGAAIYDVNDAGLAVGTYWISEPPAVQRGFVFDLNSQTYTAILMPHPGAAWCYATGINAKNEVCGTRSIGSKTDPTHPRTAFLWNGAFSDLGIMDGPSSYAADIADDGAIVGTSGGQNGTPFSRAFIWHQGTTLILPSAPGGINSAASASRNQDWVLLNSIFSDNTLHGFAYFDGAYFDLGILPGRIRTFPKAVDRTGQVFGFCTGDSVQPQAFVWRNGTMSSLQTLLSNPAAFIQQAHDISDAGLIVGKGVDLQGKSIGVVIAPLRASPGDTNCDDLVNVTDVLNVIGRWGQCYGCSADVNGDAEVGIADLLQVILNWG